MRVQHDQCDRKLSTKWQRALHTIMEKSAEPQLYLDKIERLNASYANWPFALARLGKAYLLLEDLHGALEQFEMALNLLPPLQDEKFARYVEGLQEYVKVTKSPLYCFPLYTDRNLFRLEP
jgi:tetratricopeptide (TPR) repeat protein